MTEALKLNIGCGSTKIPGWTGIDRKQGGEALPLRFNDGTPVPDNSVDEIRASHILEHFSFREVPQALEEWKRVLKPGGKMRISVPDMAKIASGMEDDPSWAYYLMGGQDDDDDFHKSAFDEKRLSAYLVNAGLVNLAHWESPNTDTAAHPVSLNIEAYKPQPTEPETMEISIQAVMSVPRIGWNDASVSIDKTLNKFGIPCTRFNGVFWGQCMQRAFQEAVEEKVDWLLCLDYDSMITVENLSKLLDIFAKRPDIDALCALQMRRGQEYPLMTVGHSTQVELSNTPIKATTAHFGLTLFRMEHMKDVQKPWFFSKPDEQGEWGDNRLDDDIWFWHQWRQAGKNIYVAPSVSIGHLELMVSQFDPETGEPKHIHISDWWKANGGK